MENKCERNATFYPSQKSAGSSDRKSRHKSPSKIRYHETRAQLRKKAKKVRQNEARLTQKAKLIKKLGLPEKSYFYFLKKTKPLQINQAPRRVFSHGCVVLIDYTSLELLLVARFNDYKTMEPSLFKDFEHSISTIYQHAYARGEVTKNASILNLPNHGSMRAIGWRVGQEIGKHCGMC